MSSIELALAISLPLIVLSIVILSGLTIRAILLKSDKSFKGKAIFKVDPFSRKVISVKTPYNQNSLFRHMHSKDWIKHKVLIKEFNSSDVVDKLFRDTLNSMVAKKGVNGFTFDSSLINRGKKRYAFTFSFNEIEDDSNFYMTIDWKSIKKNRKVKSSSQLVDRETIISLPEKYKSFIAFNLNYDITDSANRLIEIIDSIDNQRFKYFRNNDVMVIVFESDNINKLTRQTTHFVNKVKVKGGKLGANIFYKGSGYLILENVSTNSKMNQTLRALDFFIIISINNKIEFISNSSESYKADEFKKYAEGSKLFRKAVRSGDLSTVFHPVRNSKNRKTGIQYGTPLINGLNEHMLNQLLTNRNNKIEMINAHAKKVGVKKSLNEPLLLDVYSDWLIDNHKDLVYKKAIYVINIKYGTKFKLLKDVISSLREKGFFFAIRVSSFSEVVATLIKQSSPQFVIVDESVWGDNGVVDSKAFISLLSIKKLTEADNITLIYENPSKLIDKKTSEEISLNFFYDTK